MKLIAASFLFVLLHTLPLPVLAEWRYETWSAMGTKISLSFWEPSQKRAAAAVDGVKQEMRRVDEGLSPYKPTSELSQVNLMAAKAPQKISPEFVSLLDKSLYFGELSQGAFDITFASVGRYYDYRGKAQPDTAQREALLEAINFRHVRLDRQQGTVFFSHPHVYIDLGGIAKGHAVDRAASLLLDMGIAHASVSAGGDSRVIGDKRGKPWMVGIKNPRQQRGDVDTLIRMPLTDVAVSTSGDYERFFIDEDSGERVHHILNPKTGMAAQGVVSVTVLGEQGVDTDPLSTTVFVLGVEKGLALVNRLAGFDCVIIDSRGKAHYSEGLADPMAEK